MSQATTETKNVPDVFKRIPIALSNPVKITDTLQGSIWRASTTTHGSVVVKLTNQNQHYNSISIHNNTIYRNIKENIVSEQSILKHLSQQTNSHQFITKFIRFFKSDGLFVFVQQDGGHSLFNFVETSHKLLKSGRIEIRHWKEVVKVVFKRLVECVAFIHSHNVCHNDLSLENILINDIPVAIDEFGKIKFETESIQLKLCDFGLAECHTNSECISSKHCGKAQYKSPEVIDLKSPFSGKKNDIWCIGVVLFMLSFGCPPWNSARLSDDMFCCILNGHIVELLKAWSVWMCADLDGIDLIQSIFKYEENRITVTQMLQHPFLN
eukprot:185278_1